MISTLVVSLEDSSTVTTPSRPILLKASPIRFPNSSSLFADIVAMFLIMVVAITYLVSYFYDKMGSFTIKVNKYDMARQGITLSETPDIDNPKSRLNADIKVDMYNISGLDLPKDLDEHDGSHNGDNYIAYTFYLANSGSDTVAVKYSLDIFGEGIRAIATILPCSKPVVS